MTTAPELDPRARADVVRLVRDLAAAAGDPDTVADVLREHAAERGEEPMRDLAVIALWLTFTEGFSGPVPLDPRPTQEAPAHV